MIHYDYTNINVTLINKIPELPIDFTKGSYSNLLESLPLCNIKIDEIFYVIKFDFGNIDDWGLRIYHHKLHNGWFPRVGKGFVVISKSIYNYVMSCLNNNLKELVIPIGGVDNGNEG